MSLLLQNARLQFMLTSMLLRSLSAKEPLDPSANRIKFSSNFTSKLHQAMALVSMLHSDSPHNGFMPWDPQPAFTAVKAIPFATRCHGGPCPVVFDRIVSDNSNQFNLNTGFFICDIPGLYFFTYSATSPVASHFRLSLYKNEQEIVSAYGRGDGFGAASNSAVLFMNRGDKACLQLHDGQLYESPLPFRAYTSFSGFRLNSPAFEPPNNLPEFERPVNGVFEPGPREPDDQAEKISDSPSKSI